MADIKCPECGGLMQWEDRENTLEYKGHTKKIKTLGYWCVNCGEGILTGEPLVQRERAYQELKAELDGVLGPKEVAEIRSKLGLSQRQAGELLGGGPRAFYKYESGKQIVSVPMSHLLKLLAKDPKRLEEICKTDA